MKEFEAEVDQTEFLKKHSIKLDYRTKMVDWMIEVLTTFSCSDQTLFLAVNLMDRFFKNCETPMTG